MILLSVVSSAAIASAALLRDGEVIAVMEADPAKKHAETLFPLMQDVLKKAGLALPDIDAFAVDVGPGSFTGVRIGVCAVNAMAFALKKPVIAVDSLSIVAESHLGADARVCVLIDAGHGASYAAQYTGGQCATKPCAVETEALLHSLPAGTVVVSGQIPDAAALAKAAWRRRASAADVAVPLYVQPSQAERLYQKRMGETHG